MKRFTTFALAAALMAVSMLPSLAGGVIVRTSGDPLIIRRAEDDSSGAPVSTGTTTLSIWEQQADGTFKIYDWTSKTFVVSGAASPTASMVNQSVNGSATGVWTAVISASDAAAAFTKGRVYVTSTNNALASPARDREVFVWGGADGDLTTDSGGNVAANAKAWNGAAISTGVPNTANLDATVSSAKASADAATTAANSNGTAITALSNKVGTPSGASVVADIGAVKTSADAATTAANNNGTAIAAQPAAFWGYSGGRTITGGSLTTAPPTLSQILSGILANPLYPIGTDSQNRVTTANPATGGSALTASDVWTYSARGLTDKTGFSLSSAEETAIVDRWMQRTLGHNMTAGQLLVILQARNAGAAGANTWDGTQHRLTTVLTLPGDSAPVISDVTTYPNTQVTNPAVTGRTSVLGTVPQP